jgi:hypothetical protein
MKIKKLNEQFAQTFSGDGFNSSNGVFKVKYKAFDDLSKAKGREINPYDHIKGEEYQIGDIVLAKLSGSSKKKKIKAEVIASARTEDGKGTNFKIRSLRSKKIYTVPSYALEFYDDRGHRDRDQTGASTISNKEKFLNSLKYNNGNFIWGSLESKNNDMRTDMLLKEGDSVLERPSIIDPSIKVVLIDTNHPDYDLHIENFKKLGGIYTIPENKSIYIHKENPIFSKFNDNHLIVIEAVEIAKMLAKDSTIDEKYSDVLAAQILRNKGHKDAYKIIASNFLKKHGVSYGEAVDELSPSMKQHLPEREM